MKKLVFATNNKHKIKEVQQMLPFNIQLISLEEIGCTEDIPETSDTIEGNAIMKAQYIHEKYGYDVFADDTGLEVSTLNNEPGVFSARYAGEHKNSNDNVSLLLKNLEGKDNRQAQFKTIIALFVENQLYTFEGIIKGIISPIPKGENGFGYDPVFIPQGYDQTFAEISSQEKNKISHRAKATEKLIDFLNNLI